jgi:hypothetical protein
VTVPLLDAIFNWAQAANSRNNNGAEALEVSGFSPGQPVPARVLNALFGRITDYLRSTVGGVWAWLPGSLLWRAGAAASISVGGTTLTIERTGVGLATADAVIGPVPAQGASPTWSALIGNIDADTAITLLVTAPGASLITRYQVIATPADANSTVTLAYAPTTTPLDGPDEVYLQHSALISIALAGSASDEVEIRGILCDYGS